MYKICSQFLIVLSCVMLMVVSLQVDYVMIACILTGIIVCTFIDMQDVPQMSPANKSKTADRALDLILAVYILSGIFFAPSFFMLPYAAMVFRKRKYTVSRMAAALVGIAVFVDCILKLKHIAPGFGRYLWLTKLQDIILNDILRGCTSHGFCDNALIFHRATFGVSDEAAQHERCVHGA